MKKLTNYNIDKIILIIIFIFYSIGVFIHAIDRLFVFALASTEIFLYFINLGLIVYIFFSAKDLKFFFTIITIIILTVIIEIIGVKTGHIFGAYHYGNIWKLTVAGVPIVIGINWLAYILASSSITRTIFLTKNPLFHAFLTGISIVILDFILEKVAIRLDYWHWLGGKVPFQNYAVWFGIAFIIQIMFNLLKIKIKTRLLNVYYITNLVFFIIILLVTK